jgi:hypothetical protein
MLKAATTYLAYSHMNWKIGLDSAGYLHWSSVGSLHASAVSCQVSFADFGWVLSVLSGFI